MGLSIVKYHNNIEQFDIIMDILPLIIQLDSTHLVATVFF